MVFQAMWIYSPEMFQLSFLDMSLVNDLMLQPHPQGTSEMTGMIIVCGGDCLVTIVVAFCCQPDEPLISLVTTNRTINVYGCCNVTHVFCPSLFVFCWE